MSGELSANEFSELCDNFLLVDESTEAAHNRIICAVLYNIGRDSPEPGPATWVSSAAEKSSGTSTSKPAVTSDAGEQRLKKEIMAIHPRDRQRIKTALQEHTGAGGNKNAASTAGAEEESAYIRANYEQYYNDMRIKPPETASTNTGAGLTRTNWELEIRKRYTQPLFAETMEFPDQNTVYARMVPMCYESGVTNGTSINCAELVVVAVGTHIKNILHDAFNRVRVNGPTYDNGHAGGPMTAAYNRQVLREDTLVKAGKLLRSRDDDLLPVESKEAQSRRPLGLSDIKLASKVGPTFWNGKPLVGLSLENTIFDNDIDEWYAQQIEEPEVNGLVNGHDVESSEDEMDLDDDDDDFGWAGAGAADQAAMRSILGDCLTAGAA